MNLNSLKVSDAGYLMVDQEQIQINTGTAVIMFSDRFVVASYPFKGELITDFCQEKLLELRIFNKDAELKVFRGSLGNELKYRYLSDTDSQDYYDDEQYLDVDEKRSIDSDNVRATGGGIYSVPLVSFCGAKIKLRNYVRYDENGQCYIWDWRLLEFFNEGVN